LFGPDQADQLVAAILEGGVAEMFGGVGGRCAQYRGNSNHTRADKPAKWIISHASSDSEVSTMSARQQFAVFVRQRVKTM
jgi:hypothetical protein